MRVSVTVTHKVAVPWTLTETVTVSVTLTITLPVIVSVTLAVKVIVLVTSTERQIYEDDSESKSQTMFADNKTDTGVQLFVDSIYWMND